ncbi:MAG: Hpt domain-containing protein [Kordiimonadaceae bacterium]|nr:Hpt domain-containing protein [Kordiimonadaceae bacterium]
MEQRRAYALDYDLLNMLRKNQSNDKFIHLMEQCVSDIKESLHIVGDGLANNDFLTIERGSHKLKSLAGTFGLEDTFKLAVLTNEAHHKNEPESLIKKHATDLLASGQYSLRTLQVYISGIE